jgi:hypothetical protein
MDPAVERLEHHRDQPEIETDRAGDCRGPTKD